MRILEIGIGPYVAAYAPKITDFYSVSLDNSSGQRLGWRAIRSLGRRLRAGEYDLVIYHIAQKVNAPWHRDGFRLWGWFQLLVWILFSPYKVAWHHFHHVLCGTTTPLVIIDAQDAPRISKTESFWLDRAQFWFMRELPSNHFNLFLNMDRRCGDVTNVRRQERLQRNFAKIRPFGLGFGGDRMPSGNGPGPVEKIHDVFYAGQNHTSTVREQGMEELKALQESGLRIHLPTERLSVEKFLRICAQSWLVWSPEGQGWDCFRHYESLLAGSVPLINSPTIERLWPLIEGEHCHYYMPERGGLTRAIHAALLDRDRLLRISAQGRAFALEHHRLNAYVRHVLEATSLLEQAKPYLQDI
jgi:hypothetical protein